MVKYFSTSGLVKQQREAKLSGRAAKILLKDAVLVFVGPTGFCEQGFGFIRIVGDRLHIGRHKVGFEVDRPRASTTLPYMNLSISV